MALLAKNRGMVSTWPIPMKRSRVFTMQATDSENMAKMADPSVTINITPRMGKNSHRSGTCSASATR